MRARSEPLLREDIPALLVLFYPGGGNVASTQLPEESVPLQINWPSTLCVQAKERARVPDVH